MELTNFMGLVIVCLMKKKKQKICYSYNYVRGVECKNSIETLLQKLVLGTRVEKGCATGATCSIQDLEKGISGVLSSITGNRASGE